MKLVRPRELIRPRAILPAFIGVTADGSYEPDPPVPDPIIYDIGDSEGYDAVAQTISIPTGAEIVDIYCFGGGQNGGNPKNSNTYGGDGGKGGACAFKRNVSVEGQSALYCSIAALNTAVALSNGPGAVVRWTNASGTIVVKALGGNESGSNVGDIIYTAGSPQAGVYHAGGFGGGAGGTDSYGSEQLAGTFETILGDYPDFFLGDSDLGNGGTGGYGPGAWGYAGKWHGGGGGGSGAPAANGQFGYGSTGRIILIFLFEVRN